MHLLGCGEQVEEPVQACSGIRGNLYKAAGASQSLRTGTWLGAQGQLAPGTVVLWEPKRYLLFSLCFSQISALFSSVDLLPLLQILPPLHMVECSLSLQGRETLGPSCKFSGEGPVGLAWTMCLSLLGVEDGALCTYMAFAHGRAASQKRV